MRAVNRSKASAASAAAWRPGPRTARCTTSAVSEIREPHHPVRTGRLGEHPLRRRGEEVRRGRDPTEVEDRRASCRPHLDAATAGLGRRQGPMVLIIDGVDVGRRHHGGVRVGAQPDLVTHLDRKPTRHVGGEPVGQPARVWGAPPVPGRDEPITGGHHDRAELQAAGPDGVDRCVNTAGGQDRQLGRPRQDRVRALPGESTSPSFETPRLAPAQVRVSPSMTSRPDWSPRTGCASRP